MDKGPSGFGTHKELMDLGGWYYGEHQSQQLTESLTAGLEGGLMEKTSLPARLMGYLFRYKWWTLTALAFIIQPP